MIRKSLALLWALPLISCQNTNPQLAENTTPENSPENPTIIEQPLAADSTKTTEAKVELVFCLDATGSMSGLISTAKEKIWDIVTVMAQQQPAPEIRLGMVFYRDRGDDFITKTLQHTTSIDSIYTELLDMEASGGGDSPESVNQALWEAVNDLKWSESPNTYRSVFVVGDCPPHMDYNEQRYEQSCELAIKKRITINTIKLGNSCRDAIPHFQKMAEATNGTYLHLDQNASDQIINTPYDDSIRKVSIKIDESRLYYGSKVEKEAMNSKKEMALELYDKASSNAAASRAKYNMSESGKKNIYGRKELIEDLKANKIALQDLKAEELPDELKDLSPEAQKIEILRLKKERSRLESELLRLSKKRDAFISEKRDADPDAQSFSKQIFRILQAQAADAGVII
jgi:Mg-chelatase subunit ChlD